MKRIFWATCPSCERSFIVNWELRFGTTPLWCPFCSRRFRAEEAARLDERY